jgi:hypothetical protein
VSTLDSFCRWCWFFFVFPGVCVWVCVGLLMRCAVPGWQVFPELRGWIKFAVVCTIVVLSMLLWLLAFNMVRGLLL